MLRTTILTMVVCAIALVPALAKPDYTRRTSKECNYCHPPNSRALNEAGKYYQEHKNSLKGYTPKESDEGKVAGKKPASKSSK
jgi:hypothetical protein